MDAVGARKISDTLMQNERWKAAVAFLKEHEELVKEDFSLSWTIGWAHWKQEQFGEARRFLLQALQLARGPRDECVGHWALGLSYLGLGKHDQAEVSRRESLRIGDYSPARLDLALLLMELGRFAEAEQLHLDGIQLKPKSRARWEAYSAFLSDVGRETEAQGGSRKSKYRPRCRSAGVVGARHASPDGEITPWAGPWLPATRESPRTPPCDCSRAS
jgi:tetratricopeptide (TPR) repeat protein